jgi:SAM-dependent methyltransferase
MKLHPKDLREDKEEMRFKLCWENKAKAVSHLDTKYEKEISFGKAPALEWSRDDDKNTFSCLEKTLEMERKDDAVLDIGCGPLARAEVQFGLEGIKIIGFDISRTIIKRAKQYAIENKVVENVDFVIGDAEFLPFRACAVGSIISFGTISHLPSLGSAKKAIKEMARVVSRGGIVYVNWFQNLYSVFGIQELLVLKIMDLMNAERVQMLLFRGPNDVQRMFQDARLSVTEIRCVSTIAVPTPSMIPLYLRRCALRVQNILDSSHVLQKIPRHFDVVAHAR